MIAAVPGSQNARKENNGETSDVAEDFLNSVTFIHSAPEKRLTFAVPLDL